MKAKVPDLELVRERQKQNYDSLHGVKTMHNPGQMVWLPSSRVEVQVDTQVAPRSYTVNTPQGKISELPKA